MSKRITASKNENFWILLFFALFALALLSPLTPTYYLPNLGDYINHLAEIVQSKMALSEGQFPLRVAPLEQAGFRYPTYQFYSPTSYLIAGSIYKWLTPNSPILALKLTLWLAVFVGGYGMYRLALWTTQSRAAALLAGIVYLISPYYMIVLLHIGSFNEPIALGLIPFTIYYTFQRFYDSNNLRYLSLMSLGWYLILTTHLVTFIYTAIFCSLLLSILTLQNISLSKNLIRVGIGFVFACLLGMWFIAPIVYLSKYLIASNMFASPEFFHSFKPGLWNLLFASTCIIPSEDSAFFHIRPSIGWPVLFAVFISSFAYVKQYFVKQKRLQPLFLSILICFYICIFFIWAPINIFYYLPKIFIVGEYSWRYLSQAIWLGALLFAAAASWLFQENLDLRKTLIAICILVLAANIWNNPPPNSKISVKEFMKNPVSAYSQNNYVLDMMKSATLINNIDSIFLTYVNPNKMLPLNTNIRLSPSLIQMSSNPKLQFSGFIATSELADKKLNVFLNDKLMKSIDLSTGNYKWELNIPKINPAILKFTIPGTKTATFPADLVLLKGIMPPQATIDAQTTKKFCRQEGTTTLCNLSIPSAVKLIELPILYYPQLLQIHLNGKSIPYSSVLYEDYLIAAVKPVIGNNQISINFVGLGWANKISWVSWILWLLVFMAFWVRR